MQDEIAPVDALVIGGGVSGLLAARRLTGLGLRVGVWEAAPSVGGWVQTLDWPGPVGEPGYLERGPQGLRFHTGSALDRLVRELGLSLRRQHRLGPRWLLDASGLRPWPSGLGLLRDLGISAALRLLLEPFAPGPRPGESLADVAARRLGSGFATHLFPPLVGSLLAADPAELDPLALPGLARGDRWGGWSLEALRHGPARRWIPEGRMGSLATGLAANLAVRTSRPLLRLTRADAGWWAESNGLSLMAKRVVLALPASDAAGILDPIAPDAAGGLREIRSTPLWIRHTRHAPTFPDLGLRVHPAAGSACIGIQGRRQGPWLQLSSYFHSPEGSAPPLPDLGPVLQERWTEALLPLIPPGHAARMAAVLASLPSGLDVIGAWRWGPGLADLAEGAAAWE